MCEYMCVCIMYVYVYVYLSICVRMHMYVDIGLSIRQLQNNFKRNITKSILQNHSCALHKLPHLFCPRLQRFLSDPVTQIEISKQYRWSINHNVQQFDSEIRPARLPKLPSGDG
jgi:hypothetical protein